MPDVIYNLFCISKGLNENVRVPVKIFLSKNYEEAELYFKSEIEYEQKKEHFALYKIGEMNKRLQLTNKKIFITGGYELESKRKKQKIEQIKLEYKNDETANFKKSLSENLKILFGGKVIE